MIDTEKIVEAFAEIDKRRNKMAETHVEKELDEYVENEFFSLVQRAKSDIKARFEHVHESRGRKIRNAVIDYSSSQSRLLMNEAEQGGVLLRYYDYDTAYNELTYTKSRDSLITSLRHLLDQTREAVLAGDNREDAGIEYRAISREYVKLVKRLEGIVVCDAPDSDGAKGDQTTDDLFLAPDDDETKTEEVVDLELDKALDDEFSGFSSPGEQFKKVYVDVEARAERFGSLLEGAEDKVEGLDRSMSEKVAGAIIDCEWLEPFQGDVFYTADFDKEKLLELDGLVEKAFETYKQVIRDNGIFDAFPEGSKALLFKNGKLRTAQYLIMPDSIKKPKTNLDNTIATLQTLLKRPYMGILDDDYKYFVDVFWFGYAKLAQFISEGLYFDTSEVDSYFASVEKRLGEEAFNLGYQMDVTQLDTYVKQIEELLD